MSEQINYSLPDGLLQAIISNLNRQPAVETRGLLNGIEAECVRQDQERADAAAARQREAIAEEVKQSLLKSLDEKVHTSAHPLPQIPEVAGTSCA
jgi:hypothetical protein